MIKHAFQLHLHFCCTYLYTFIYTQHRLVYIGAVLAWLENPLVYQIITHICHSCLCPRGVSTPLIPKTRLYDFFHLFILIQKKIKGSKDSFNLKRFL